VNRWRALSASVKDRRPDADLVHMRHVVATIGIVAVVGLTGCSTSGSGAGTPGTSGTRAPPGNPISGPTDSASTVVDELNSRLSEQEQRTGSMDPTVP
jgi:hypothetical protein